MPHHAAQHLHHANQQGAALPVLRCRQGSARMQDVKDCRTFEGTSARDREEVGPIGGRRPPGTLGYVQDYRGRRAVELIAQAGRCHTQPCGQRGELDGHAVGVEPVDVEDGGCVGGDGGKGHIHLLRPASVRPLTPRGRTEAGRGDGPFPAVAVTVPPIVTVGTGAATAMRFGHGSRVTDVPGSRARARVTWTCPCHVPRARATCSCTSVSVVPVRFRCPPRSATICRVYKEAPPIRIRMPLVVALVAAPLLLLQAAPSNEPVIVLLEGERREVTPVLRAGAELLPLQALLPALGVSATTDARGGSVTLTFDGRQVTLYDKKSLASVGGDLRLMSGARAPRGGPLAGARRRAAAAAGPAPEQAGGMARGLARAARGQRAGAAGERDDVRVRRLRARGSRGEREGAVPGEPGGGPRDRWRCARDLLDVPYEQERLTGGIVDRVQFVGRQGQPVRDHARAAASSSSAARRRTGRPPG